MKPTSMCLYIHFTGKGVGSLAQATLTVGGGAEIPAQAGGYLDPGISQFHRHLSTVQSVGPRTPDAQRAKVEGNPV